MSRGAGRSRRQALGVGALALSAVVLVGHLYYARSTGILAFDSKLYTAERLIAGKTIYPAGGPGSGDYPYPPLWAVLMTPFLVLPTLASQYAVAILCLGAILGALWVVRVRDPFCYAIALASISVVSVVRIGNPSAVVALLAALAYRYNSAPTGVAIALKLYAWPLLVWGAVTRGRRDLMLGLLAATAGVLVPWALIGFDGIGRYLTVMREITGSTEGHTYALPIWVAAPTTVLALVAMWVRRRDPAGAFAFAVLALLAATPVLWVFYFSIVFVPLAIQRQTFSAAWLVPFAMWFVGDHVHLASMILLLAWCGLGAPSLDKEWLTARHLRPALRR